MKELNPTARKNNIVIQELEAELIVYLLDTDQAFCLNETSALVWKNCNGKISIADLSKIFSKEMKTLISDSLIEFTIEQLNRENLLDHKEPIQTSFVNLSRRQAIKKIGFASMVALPIISTVVAPASIQAASCLSNATIRPCVVDGSCVLLAPDFYSCPDAECCSGFCARLTINAIGNCAS